MADPLEPAPDATLDEDALLARAGDAEAADRLWAALGPRLARIGLALGVRSSEVPDLVQDVLVAAHRALPRFDPAKGSVAAWTASMLLRRARNVYRAERRRLRLVDALFRRAPHAAPDEVGPLEARLTIERLLAALTPAQRDVVALYEIGELPAADVAEVLGVTAAGVRSTARDARRRLADAARNQAAGDRR